MIFTACSSSVKSKRLSSCLYLNTSGELLSLHPNELEPDIAGRSVGKLLFEGLTRLNHSGTPVLGGAKDVDISPDGKKYIFTLRENYWSDGTLVTAHDYVNTWRYALQPHTDCIFAHLFYVVKNARAAKQGIVPIEDVGVYHREEDRLCIELAHPLSTFLQLLAQPQFAPLKHPELKEPIVFNGPFVCADRVKNKSILLKPNPFFWNKKAVGLHSIHIHCIQDASTIQYMFEKGHLDWIGDPLTIMDKDTGNMLVETGVAATLPVDRFFLFYINTTHPLLQSKKIRQALAMSVDNSQITRHLVFGQPITRCIKEEHYIPTDHKWRVLEAQRLFAEGIEELGLYDSYIDPIELSYVFVHKSIALYLQECWQSTFGITIHTHMCEWSSMRQKLEKGNFDLAGYIGSVLSGDSIDLLSKFIDKQTGNNHSRWDCKKFAEKLSQCIGEENGNKRSTLMIEAEDILQEEAPVFPLYRAMHVYAHHPDLKGHVIDRAGCVDFSYAHFQ